MKTNNAVVAEVEPVGAETNPAPTLVEPKPITVTLTEDQFSILVKCYNAEANTKQLALQETAKVNKVDVIETYINGFFADAVEEKGKWANDRAEKAYSDAWKFAKLAGVNEAAFRALMGMPEIKPAIPAGSTVDAVVVVNPTNG